MKIWPDFFNMLPAKFVYFCAMRVWVEATSGCYSPTVVSEIEMAEAIARFARKYAIRGHGRDSYFDSNRKEKT